MNQKSLSIFIPVYNEEKIIDYTIQEVSRILESITDDYEILIIDDGSTDSSKEKILKWRSNKIKLVEHHDNLGYGFTLRDGFKRAKKDFVLYTDADMSVDLTKLADILPLMGTYDLIIGYRVNRTFTARRFIYSKVYNLLMRLLLKVRAKDVNCSFKCVRREVLEKINLTAKSVFIDGELLAEAVRNNFTLKEIPFIHLPRKYGKSNFDSLKAAISTMRELLSYWAANIFSNRR